MSTDGNKDSQPCAGCAGTGIASCRRGPTCCTFPCSLCSRQPAAPCEDDDGPSMTDEQLAAYRAESERLIARWNAFTVNEKRRREAYAAWRELGAEFQGPAIAVLEGARRATFATVIEMRAYNLALEVLRAVVVEP